MANLFDQIVKNFENAMRGVSIIDKKEVKSFPHVAGSVFISKIVSLLRTMINEKNVYSDLDTNITKERIYRNGKAVITSLVLDETVEMENMLIIFESFQNVSVDVYMGMKDKGKYGKLQKELKDFDLKEELEQQDLEV